MNDKQIAELFIEQHVLQPSQADDVLNEVTMNGKSIAQAMVDTINNEFRPFPEYVRAALGHLAAVAALADELADQGSTMARAPSSR